jgi:hypothetical protein
MSIFILVFAVGVLRCARAEQKKEKHMSQYYDVNLLGKQLRNDIDEIYNKLPMTSGLTGRGIDTTDIASAVTKYIPIGISFDAAEAILKSAGFIVLPRQPNPHLTDIYPEKYNVVATIDQHVDTHSGRMLVSVSLTPSEPNNYSVVKKLTAFISRHAL